MKSVVNLRSDGGVGCRVKVRAGNPVEAVETLGFSWQPEDRAFTTGDATIALALLHSPDVILLVERDVADAIRNAAATISMTGGATEKPVVGDIISVTADETKTPEKRKRGRPAKAEEAMTAAERARRYRRKHKPSWQTRRIDLAPVTVDRIERIVAETGLSVDEVVRFAVTAASSEYWESLKAERLFREGLRV